jgi:hypothetical protein
MVRLSWTREVCGGERDVGLEAYVYTHGDQLEEARCFRIQDSGPYTLQVVDWLFDVSGQH